MFLTKSVKHQTGALSYLVKGFPGSHQLTASKAYPDDVIRFVRCSLGFGSDAFAFHHRKTISFSELSLSRVGFGALPMVFHGFPWVFPWVFPWFSQWIFLLFTPHSSFSSRRRPSAERCAARKRKSCESVRDCGRRRWRFCQQKGFAFEKKSPKNLRRVLY